MRKEDLRLYLDKTFTGLTGNNLPPGVKFRKGKVRDILDAGDSLFLITTDRISAFDRVLSSIPGKGEILNRLSLYWFNTTQNILENHVAEEISPRTIRVKPCEILPVEVVVRGFLTGSAYRDYSAGKTVSGISLPKNMKRDQKFEKPLITPSTKEEAGAHDQPISREDIISSGIVTKKLWEQVEEAAYALFRKGSEILAARNLLLVDTKYEFGLSNGKLVLADEVHTPDSSRFWFLDTYQALFEKGADQKKLDKEYLRQWLMEQGFSGDGNPPVILDEVRIEVALRYIEAFERITGETFSIFSETPQAEEKKILSYIM